MRPVLLRLYLVASIATGAILGLIASASAGIGAAGAVAPPTIYVSSSSEARASGERCLSEAMQRQQRVVGRDFMSRIAEDGVDRAAFGALCVQGFGSDEEIADRVHDAHEGPGSMLAVGVFVGGGVAVLCFFLLRAGFRVGLWVISGRTRFADAIRDA